MGMFDWLTRYLDPGSPSLDVEFAASEEEVSVGKELGGTGSAIFNGSLGEDDYNNDWDSAKRYGLADKMRLGDGQVRAGLSVIKLPLLSATWHIEPADDSPLQKQMSEELEANLIGGGMTVSWQDTLRHILLMEDYGSMPFEIVWEIRNGKVRIHKLAPRMPKTVTKWKLDEHGGFAGIEQTVTKNDGGLNVIDIEPEKMLVFVNEREGSNYRGISILRPAYKHWYMKDRFYIIDAITQEKRGLGIDVAHLNEKDVSASRRRQAEQALMSVRSHEKNFMVEPDWMTYRVEGVGRGATRDALPSIEHHDLRILRSMLAEFIAAQGGELALGGSVESNSSFFLMALGAIGFNIEDTVSRYLIPRWVIANYGKQEQYPRLKHSRLDTRDNAALATSVAALVTAGLITPDTELEAMLREVFELPEKLDGGDDTEALKRKLRKRLWKKDIKLGVKDDIGFGPGIRLTGGVRVDFGAMEDALDHGQEAIVAAVKKVQARQIKSLVTVASKVIKDKRGERLVGLTVPFQDELAKVVAEELRKLYRQGGEEVKKELSFQGLTVQLAALEPDEIEDFLGIRARALTGVIADRLKSSVVWEALRQLRTGELDEEALTTVLTDLSDREVNKVASNTVSEALNLGRDAMAMRNANRIERVEFSALLDGETCDPCSDKDGEEFEFGSAAYEQARPPYQDCEGQGRCRCVFVFVLSSEGEVE